MKPAARSSHTQPTYTRTLAIAAYFIAFMVLVIPTIFVITQAFHEGIEAFLLNVVDVQALAALRLTLAVTCLCVILNSFFGALAAWCLSRFSFYGKKILIALIDLPLATSPIIGGMVWLLLFGQKGWWGTQLATWGIHIIFTPFGVLLATLFVTMPYVTRTLLPIMSHTNNDTEEAAMLLGAGFWTILFKVTLPQAGPALLSGILLTTARALGEFGAVAIVSGHIPGLTETIPLQIETLYNNYQSTAAFSLALILILFSLLTVVLRHIFQPSSTGVSS